MDSLQGTIDLIRGDTIAFNEIAKELKAIFPDLESCAFAKAQIAHFESYRVEQPTLIVQWPANKTTRSRRTDESKISAFIAERLNMPVSLISR